VIPVPLSPLPDDGRDYRLYRHASGMRCLLISDPAAARGTCVMQVDCGSHDEPDSHPGLAHLLEHMLFMGSAGYSAPGSFAALVTRWSGRFNASTAAEITRFFFTASPEGLTIWWGAYLGSGDQILCAGPLAEVSDEIATMRAEARERHGWIMDTYLLRRG